MKVSIVTPTYNSEKYLKETIESVLNQDYKNIQYIIIDGDSTDGTKEILNIYKDKIDIIISEKDKGMYDAINKGLKLADGDIITYINSDDVYENNQVISKVVDFFKKNKDVDWIYSNYYTIDEKSNKTQYNRIPMVNYKEFLASDWSYIPQPTSLWRKKIIEDNNFFDSKYKMAADYEFFLRLVKNYKVSKVNFVIADFRKHEESLSATRQKLSEEEMKNIKLNEGYKNKIDIFKYTLFFKYKIMNFTNYLRKKRK